MTSKVIHQVEFSSVLFDTLFGLILFYSFDYFFDVTGILPFIFYLFSMFVLLHWWLLFKASDDLLDEEVSNSALDTIFGILDVILIYYIVLMASRFDVKGVNLFIILLLVSDLLWSLIWRYVGKWQTKSLEKIKIIENELSTTIKINSVAIVLMAVLFFSTAHLTVLHYCIFMMLIYIIFIIATFRFEIADIKWF